MKNRRLNDIYYAMKYRCYNQKATSYKYYGAKGIRVCDEWLNDFQKFKEWAYENGYRDDLTIDRLDSTKDYEPNNCRWVTKSFNAKRVKKGDNNYTEEEIRGKDIYSPRIKIIKFREDLGIPQYIMAKKLGITPYRYDLMEKGIVEPTFKNLEKFQKEFNYLGCIDVLDMFKKY